MASSPVHILSRRVSDFLERTQRLAPFQRRFIRGAFTDGVDLAALCGPRGLGKSSLSGELLACALDPDGPLHEPGSESILLAGSLDQARAAFRFLRARCPEDKGFKYTDSGQRVSVHHKVTNTRIRVASSDAKRAFGIVGARLVVGDEPAAWQERGGALSTAGGKNEMLLLLIGTLAPGSPTGWWHKLINTGNSDRRIARGHEPTEPRGGRHDKFLAIYFSLRVWPRRWPFRELDARPQGVARQHDLCAHGLDLPGQRGGHQRG